jgi:excisionase family DNA binding protein
MNRLLVAREAWTILNISRSRFYDLVRRGVLPPGVVIKLGERQLRFNEEALRQWIANGGLLANTNFIDSLANLASGRKLP